MKHGRAARRLTAVALAGLALSACGQAKPGVAATIDGRELSVAEVQEISDAFFDDYPEARGQVEPSELSTITVENFLRVAIVDAMGERFDAMPSDGELQRWLEENFTGGYEAALQATSGVGVPASRRDLQLDYLRFYYIENIVRELKADELGLDDPGADEVSSAVIAIEDELSAAADISVNPRYGLWDGSAMANAGDTGSGSLSVFAPGTEPVEPPPVLPGG